MTLTQRIKEVLIGLLAMLGAFALLVYSDRALAIILVGMILACLFTGIKSLVYFITMARYSIGSDFILYKSMILMNLAIIGFGLTNMPGFVVLLYLIGINFFNGAVCIMRALEMKKLGSRWRLKLSAGIVDCLMSLICICFMNTPTVLVMVYATGVIYSAVLRIINALRRTAIVYIQ